jgi:tripartite ATP-independent transporter DctM subunit
MDTTLIFLAVLFASMAIGIPIAISLLVSGVALMWHLDFFNTQLLAQNLQAGFDSFPLLAVPFFILAGELMNVGGLSQRIIDMARAFVGHIPGGLGYVAVFASVLLASMSGSAIADTAALATILLPMMRQQGYPMNYSTGLLASGGIIGPIIPPSLPFIIYGVTTNTSISKLFISGVAPGVLMGGALLIAWRAVARRRQLPTAPRATSTERRRAVTDSVWAIFMPVIILGGIYSGVFTATEASVVAVLYGLLVGGLIYRELTLRDLIRTFIDSAVMTGVIMLIVGCAALFAYMLTLNQVPQTFGRFIVDIAGGPIGFLLLANLLLFVAGMFMEAFALIIILVPILAPIAVQFGIDPIHFGMIMIVNICIGMVTPPVGVNLFITCQIANLPIERLLRPLGIFLAVLILDVLLISYIPWLSMAFL